MQAPRIHISKRERRRYKSNTAAWEDIRAGGIVRFILVRGVLLRGVPITIIIALGVTFFTNDFRLDTKFLTEPWIIVFFAFMAVIYGIRNKLDEWQINEREYKVWRLYKSKGNILNVD
jgi:hypothetical protein